MARAFHIETYGCQMNVLDSDLVGGILKRAGYVQAEVLESADVIFLNTCAVREGAENRVLHRLESIHGDLRRRRPDVVLGLLGCVAQAHGEELVARAPYVDLVVGTDRYSDLPDLLEEQRRRRAPLVEISPDPAVNYEGEPRLGPGGVTGFVAVMRGCDMGCTFCIVPQTRGEERSLRPVDVVREVQWLAGLGVREVTLLGQKVNAWKWEDARFPDLLRMVAGLEGIDRVRFTSPHPLWVTRGLGQVMADVAEVCPSVHMPLQSGSDGVLERMKRGYTADRFRRGIASLRASVGDVGVTTDVIVGFPGETEEDHRDTLEIMAELRFDSAFMFAFSPRPGTEAAAMGDQVPDEVKARRLREVIDQQESVTRQIMAEQVGRKARVLLERTSRKREDELFGRSPENRSVVVPGDASLVGQVVEVEIVEAHAHTLRARRVSEALVC